MDNIKLFMLAILSLLIFSCRENKCGIHFQKMDIINDTDNSGITEAYAVSCMDINDSLKIDTINNFVKGHYSHKLAAEKAYAVTIYKYDTNCEDGVNNSYECKREMEKGNIDGHIYLLYIWNNGMFYKLHCLNHDTISFLNPKIFND